VLVELLVVEAAEKATFSIQQFVLEFLHNNNPLILTAADLVLSYIGGGANALQPVGRHVGP
jgi:hypothetical protein